MDIYHDTSRGAWMSLISHRQSKSELGRANCGSRSRVLGSTFTFQVSSGMPDGTFLQKIADLSRFILLFLAFLATPHADFAQSNSPIPLKLPAAGGEATLEADQQRQSG